MSEVVVTGIGPLLANCADRHTRFPRGFYERYHREQQLYLASLVIALDDAHLEPGAIPGERMGIFDGTSRGNFDYWYGIGGHSAVTLAGKAEAA